jgi:hypothetical protein
MAGRRFDVVDGAEVLQHWLPAGAGASWPAVSAWEGTGTTGSWRRRKRPALAGGPPLTRKHLEQWVPELFAERVVPPIADPTKGIVRFHEDIVRGLAASTVRFDEGGALAARRASFSRRRLTAWASRRELAPGETKRSPSSEGSAA